MTTHKRKKAVRYRGSNSHGGGAKKKRRGAGHRGGRGLAGSGKRADAKKPRYWADPLYFGKHGFHRGGSFPKPLALNIDDINTQFLKWVGQGRAAEKQGKGIIDLSAVGYGKLLGGGIPARAYDITVAQASQSSVEKIKRKGGGVNVTSPQKTDDKDKTKTDDS
ncbi:MAG TPA: uL15m family ribosomal protein [Candidatus Nanoarchaeia archaeon]|nr:uL15m family ribosomal protein [Candidatus Nanoarchaeia archaeon]